MALYKLIFKPAFQKSFKQIPRYDRIKIIKRIETLAANPRPPGYEKLSGQTKYRIRQGDYRILYTIDDNEQKIRIVKVGHRKDIYRVSEEKEKYSTDRGLVNPKSKT